MSPKVENLLEKIFAQKIFIHRPPVLVDVGASGEVHGKFKPIAKYSICIAFDADDREMHQVVSKDSNDYQKLYVVNSVLSEKDDEQIPFYLTKYPYCSSTLEPDSENLKHWDRADIFEINNNSTIKATNLTKVMNELEIKSFDWFKTDSQGTDLRLFKSIGETLIQKIIVAEFEPGLINSYIGEDKMHSVHSYMDKFNFWISDIKVRGFRRLKPYYKDNFFNNIEKTFFSKCLKQSPGWAELTYINAISEEEDFSEREFYLSWVFSTILRQHGHALDIANRGLIKFPNSLFGELAEFSLKKMKIPWYLLPFYIVKKNLSKRYKS